MERFAVCCPAHVREVAKDKEREQVRVGGVVTLKARATKNHVRSPFHFSSFSPLPGPLSHSDVSAPFSFGHTSDGPATTELALDR
jgi:hypothetical protein